MTQELIEAINNTGIAQVVEAKDEPTKLHITHRVDPRRLKVWLDTIEHVLAHKQGWTAHVCKHYFVANGTLLYCWNIIAQWNGPQMKEGVINQITSLLLEGFKRANKAPKLMHQLKSYPLLASPDRNKPEGPFNLRASGYKQKGAYPIRVPK